MASRKRLGWSIIRSLQESQIANRSFMAMAGQLIFQTLKKVGKSLPFSSRLSDASSHSQSDSRSSAAVTTALFGMVFITRLTLTEDRRDMVGLMRPTSTELSKSWLSSASSLPMKKTNRLLSLKLRHKWAQSTSKRKRRNLNLRQRVRTSKPKLKTSLTSKSRAFDQILYWSVNISISSVKHLYYDFTLKMYPRIFWGFGVLGFWG